MSYRIQVKLNESRQDVPKDAVGIIINHVFDNDGSPSSMRNMSCNVRFRWAETVTQSVRCTASGLEHRHLTPSQPRDPRGPYEKGLQCRVIDRLPPNIVYSPPDARLPHGVIVIVDDHYYPNMSHPSSHSQPYYKVSWVFVKKTIVPRERVLEGLRSHHFQSIGTTPG